MSIPTLDNYVALDCEMVVTNGKSLKWETIALARVAIVDHQGKTVYDTFVHVPPVLVKDYCTSSSGVGAEDLVDAPKFEQVQAQVREKIKGKIVVGHALFNDLAALQIRLPQERTRDTALCYPLRRDMGVKREGEYPALKAVGKKVLGVEIQKEGDVGGHDPRIDAQTTWNIYLRYRDGWEEALQAGEDVTGAIPAHYMDWYY